MSGLAKLWPIYCANATTLLSIGHRIGREALRAELAKWASPEETPASREAALESILSKPPDYSQAHFQLFYRGFNAADYSPDIPWRRLTTKAE